MASAWGNSWGSAWGSSWGSIDTGPGVSSTAGVGTVTITRAGTLTGVGSMTQVWTVTAVGPVGLATYRHSVPAPIKPQRPQRLKDLEARFRRMERKG